MKLPPTHVVGVLALYRWMAKIILLTYIVLLGIAWNVFICTRTWPEVTLYTSTIPVTFLIMAGSRFFTEHDGFFKDASVSLVKCTYTRYSFLSFFIVLMLPVLFLNRNTSIGTQFNKNAGLVALLLLITALLLYVGFRTQKVLILKIKE